MKAASPIPPRAERRPHTLGLHGRLREDPYYWLRAANWQEVMRDPKALPADIRSYLEAENAYCDGVLADTASLRAQLVAEMRGRIKENDASVPLPDGPYVYYVRYEEGGQHPIYCRQPRGKKSEQILLHGDREAAGKPFFKLVAFEHAPDHARAAYAVDLNGSERLVIRIRDLKSGTDLPDTIPDAHGDIAWAADGHAFLYTKLDEFHRPHSVLLHKLGTDPAADRLIYRETSPSLYISLGTTLSKRFILLTTHDHDSTELRAVSADRPEVLAPPIAPREPGHEYGVSDHGDHFIILTNADGAEDFKLAVAPIANPGRAQWRDLVPHEPGRFIISLAVFKNHLVRLERVDALARLVVNELAPGPKLGAEHRITFSEEAYSLNMSEGYEFDTKNLRFTYSSPSTPTQTFDYDLDTRARELRKTQEVPSGHDPNAYVVRRLFAPADDGALVPVTVLHRKELKRDGTAPLLLYGYGAYGLTYPPGFATNRLSLVDRGFVYALAHIRGGKDKGYHWYTDGKLFAKRNTFTDYIAVARHLIAENYTGAGRIVGHGGSAGGLLMGAVANMAPALFRAIVAEVPFVDVLTTICDGDLPLTPPEWSEWGNPIQDVKAYDYIASYSPYDNVAPQAYPHIFALAGLTDPRVTYWEPAKWVAKLRERKTDHNLLLLHTNMGAGHSGSPGRFDALAEVALAYAFMLKVSGLLE